MNKDRDWKKVFHKKFVQHYYGADDFYNFHGYGSKEVDLVISFIEEEIDRQLEISAKDTNTLYEMMKKRVKRERQEGFDEGFERGWQRGYASGHGERKIRKRSWLKV